jgi:hypothetical protein
MEPRRAGVKHVPTDESRHMVASLVANGLTQEQIAHALRISEPTLRRHYRHELDCGFTDIYAKISHTLVQRALEGEKACMIFWLKTKAGWRETSRNELTGPNGAAIDLRTLSTDDLLAAIARAESTESATRGANAAESD